MFFTPHIYNMEMNLPLSIFAVYKLRGVTSHDVVNLVRKKTGVKRVGHGGTLDPLAEGVLVIAVGRENTKLLDKYVKGDKEYIATLRLGYTSETDDEEGNKTIVDTNKQPDLLTIQEIIKGFIGNIKQTPPHYSAIKINGKEAYKRIRKGEDFKMEERDVFIKRIEILKYEYPALELKIECGTGVYIRSLARDIGDKLKTGAYLSKLIRTRVGEFKLEDAVKMENVGN